MLFSFFLSITPIRYIVMYKNPLTLNSEAKANIVSKAQTYMTENDKIVEHMNIGFIAEMKDETAHKMGNDPEIAVVEKDTPVRITYKTEKLNYRSDFRTFDNFFNFQRRPKKRNLTILKNLNYKSQSYKSKNYKDQDFEKLKSKFSFSNPKNPHLDNFDSENFNTNLENNKSNTKYSEINNIIEETPIKNRRPKITPWGLKRIFEPSNWDKNDFQFPIKAGKGVEVFVIDTGIDATHPEFEGRARFGANFVPGSPNTDDNGHGTHVAGIIGSNCCGVAKKTNLVGVKVLDSHGVGMISRVIQGIDYVINQHSKKYEDETYNIIFKHLNKNKPLVITGDGIFLREEDKISLLENESTFKDDLERAASVHPLTVVNMSVGGLKNRALEYAVQFASDIGIHFSVAAGNDHRDACDFSPSASQLALTVGASTKDDKSAFFSNFGKCVDIYAPGVDILSLWSRGGYKVASGTSMAAPHVAGAMALYLEARAYTPKELYKKIMGDAVRVVDKKPSKLWWPFRWLDRSGLPLLNVKSTVEELRNSKKKEKSDTWVID